MPVENDGGAVGEQSLGNEDAVKRIEKVISDRLSGANQGNQQQEALNRILQHPGVQRVLQSEAAGKKYKILDEDEYTRLNQQRNAEPNIDELLKDLGDEPDNKALVKKFLEISNQTSSRNSEQLVDSMLDKKLAPILDQLKGLGGFVQKTSEQKMQDEINVAKGKYANFAEVTQEMVQLHEAYPNMGVEDLYRLAAVKSGKGIKEARNTASEKPSHSLTRPNILEHIKKSGLNGKNAFSEAIRESMRNQPEVTDFNE